MNSTIAEKIQQANAERQRISGNIADAYTALDAKGATMPQTQNSANLADTVASIPQGGGIDYSKPVEFIDYDGTVLYTYTREEALNLSALPLGVEHEGLTFHEWNWSLQGIKNYLAHHQFVIVGATYTINDGQSHCFWKNPRYDGTVSLASEIWIATNSVSCYYYYYLEKVVISKTVSSIDSFSDCVSLEAIVVPNGITISNQLFWCCRSLKKISLPENLMLANNDVYGLFYTCTALPKVSLPDSITSFYHRAGSSIFEGAYIIKQVELPHQLSTLGGYEFFDNYALKYIVLPDTISGISKALISGSHVALNAVVFLGKPTLSSSNYLVLPSNCKIYVKKANLAWYETATNWSSLFAQYIVAIEDNIQELLAIGIDINIYL